MKSCLVALVLSALPALAQQRQNFVLNVGSPEGQLLQSIGQESDEAKGMALMEDFLEKYPMHEGASWVGAQLELAYTKKKDFDKALAVGDKVAPDGPNELDLAYNALKAAEGKGDSEAVKKWSVRTSAAAGKFIGAAKGDEDKEAVEYAKQVGAYSEYALYAQALRSRDNKQTVDLGETLEKINAKSPYLWLVSPSYLRALGPKGCATADKLAAADPKNAEAMLFAADCSWRGQKPDRMISLANSAIQALSTRQKVEGGNEGGKTGTANFYLGTAYSMQGKWGPANRALRTALPAIKGDPSIQANALFNLGMANYTLGKAVGDKAQIREGMKFFQQCAELPGTLQDQASRNAKNILATELGGR